MPKVAILSDIHANLPAFEAVLREVDKCKVDLIVFGGDTVGYGASPAECVKMVRALGGHSVFGNHESMTKMVQQQGIDNLIDGWEINPVVAGVVHTFRSVAEEDLKWMWDLPWFLPLDEESIITHAGLEEPNRWPYIDSEESAAPSIKILKNRGLNVGFFGHIHRLAIFPGLKKLKQKKKEIFRLPEDKVTAITVGSVGQSRDKNDWRATWVLWDPDERTVEFRRTEYDNKLAAKQIIDAGLPEKSALRLFRLAPSSDDEL